MQGRARRRHDRWRMVQRAWRIFRMWDAAHPSDIGPRQLSEKRRPHDPERLADNMAWCSCAFCRPGRHFEARAERRIARRDEYEQRWWPEGAYLIYEEQA